MEFLQRLEAHLPAGGSGEVSEIRLEIDLLKPGTLATMQIVRDLDRRRD